MTRNAACPVYPPLSVYRNKPRLIERPSQKVNKQGYEGEAEMFGVYSPDTGKVYLIPVGEVPAGRNVILRLLKAKNNQEKGIRWAGDYEL